MLSARFKTIRFALLLVALFVVPAGAQWQSIGKVDSFVRDEEGISLNAGRTVVRISVLAPDLVRVRVARDGKFLPDQSCAVVRRDWSRVPLDVKETSDAVSLSTAEMVVRISKNPLRMTFLDRNGTILNRDDERGISWSGSAVRIWKQMPQSEEYYGLGEKAGALDRKYKHLTMWN
ncbi:MAG TPA: hypothetical protein VMH23_07360, partial [Bacteroidota bacterium]|nr:hypothetical protein [Bacteroidota bacterium]